MTENNTTTNVSYELTFNMIPLTAMSLLGAVSNALLLVAFIKDPLKCFRNSATYLVMNLAVSDCLSCLVAPFYLEAKDEIPKTASGFISDFLGICFGGVSFVSITSISFDRFLMVAYPIKHRILMEGKLIILWLTAIWTLSCLIYVLQNYVHMHGKNVGYMFSVILIVLSSVMYASTYYKLKKQSRNMTLQNSIESRAQEIRILKEKRFLKTIIIIACIAFVCVVPPMIFFLDYGENHPLSPLKDKLTSQIVGTVIVLFIYVSFAVNPFIYILRLPNYRRTFSLLYCRRKTASS